MLLDVVLGVSMLICRVGVKEGNNMVILKKGLAYKKLAVKKKKSLFTKIIIILIIFLNVAFAIGVMWLVYKVGREPSALVVSFYSFTTVQLWNMAFIKKQKEITKRAEIPRSVRGSYDYVGGNYNDRF